MKFKFKIQDYQTKAVESTVNVFKGQPFIEHVKYTRDLGIRKKENIIEHKDQFGNAQIVEKASLFNVIDNKIEPKEIENEDYYKKIENSDGFENAEIVLSDDEILKNIRDIQSINNIKLSDKLVKHLGRCSLDIEMETGTGKTYVYIKTIFELNKRYGFSKFIVVVPSIAIREGVKKTFEITEEHFMEYYHKKARYFIYNSKNLNALDSFSSSSNINVMIINAQAFNARGADARRIYESLDEFQSRRPIDVIAANKPILIIDEPQKLGGKKTQDSLKLFNSLFCLNYSATHKEKHNLVYVLDALDAYNERLVKKIEVKGFEVKNFRGTEKYLFLDDIVVSSKNPPRAKIELEIKYNKSINRETRIFDVGDNLYSTSKMEEYKENFVISEINPIDASVTFTNGFVITKGTVVGDVSEKDMRRIQIRETIESHFEKEERLFDRGIKTLSLFFIDEVAKYRVYDEKGSEQNSEYAQVFEEEYTNILNKYIELMDTPYTRYLKSIDVKDTHKGYFSIDKKTKRMVDSKAKGKSEESDDISAYDLILKNKERLLSFDEPTRFIFSHSALREGWDNPNVFQICTLKHSDSTTGKRQEVGRGLRLCVDKNGDRVDENYPGIDKNNIHDINKLTVIASESYKDFAEGLQKDIKEVLYDRPRKAEQEYFVEKKILVNNELVEINKKQAKEIYRYLIKNDYIDEDDNVTPKYRTDLENNCVAPLPQELVSMTDGVQKLIQSVFDESVLKDMMEDGHGVKVPENELNDNFYKKEFKTLWNYINHKYAYTVEFDSSELIRKSIKNIDEHMTVSQLQYTLSRAEQKDNLDINEIERGKSFKNASSKTKTLKHSEVSRIKYDLVGKVAEGTVLTRRTVVEILKGIHPAVFSMFKYNPEEFITKCIKLIKEEKAAMIVDHITYNEIDGSYDSSIFTAENSGKDFSKAFLSQKHIQDYVFTDGTAEKSVERKFAEDLDGADEVSVYAKLPRTFQIPTPVGNYSPDWAIAFKEGTVKHIYFIAETKGTMDTMHLRKIEDAKIACAKKLFNELSTSHVKYHEVDSYQTLLNIMGSL